MVLVKMLMKIPPPMMRGSVVMSMASISPSRREVFLAESLRRRAKVLMPRFRLETVALHLKVFFWSFSRVSVVKPADHGVGGLELWISDRW